MADKKTVMISSTSLDLPEHRKQAKEACERLGFFPSVMENLPARDADAIRVSLEMVDQADIYIGIYAWRYGHIPDGHDISITEMEFNRAVERKIPILVFTIHKDHDLRIEMVEVSDRAKEQLAALKDKACHQRGRREFKSAEDLRGEILHALADLEKREETESGTRPVPQFDSINQIPPAPEAPNLIHSIEASEGKPKKIGTRNEKADPSDIFLSYAREDLARAKKLAAELGAQHGWTVFWDTTIPAGQTWREFIGRNLEMSRCVVVVWSRHSIKSSWVCEEAEEGKARKILVPVLFDNIKAPLGFREIQAANFVNWTGSPNSDDFQQVVHAIGNIIGFPNDSSSKMDPTSPLKKKPLVPSGHSSKRYRNVFRATAFVLALVIGGLQIIEPNKWKPISPTSQAVEKNLGGQTALSPISEPKREKSERQGAGGPQASSPQQKTDGATNPAVAATTRVGQLAPPQENVKSVDKSLEGDLFSKDAHDILFPLYGITVGKTTVAEIQKMGQRATTINPNTGNPFPYYVVNGMNFWHDEKTNLINHVYLTKTDSIPDQWRNLEFDWAKSYSDWLKLLTSLGYSIEVTRQPKTVLYQGHDSFTAEITARPKQKGATNIELDFNYSDGVNEDSKNTLYSLRVRSY